MSSGEVGYDRISACFEPHAIIRLGLLEWLMQHTDFQQILSSPSESYQEGLRFFMGKGLLNNALRRVASDLEEHGIDYNVIGAIALNQHGYRRFTEDIDLLLTRQGLERFREELVGLGYRPAFEGPARKFQTAQENVPIKIITSGEYPATTSQNR